MKNKHNYQNPALVKSPKHCLANLKVVFDGMAENWGEESENQGWSLAEFDWYGKPSMGIRWNGNEERPAGLPQSRGIPTWFVLPQILQDVLDKDLDKGVAVLKELQEMLYGGNQNEDK